MNLMIVESPSKAKKVEKILAKVDPSGGWTVKASVGHIRDLPASPKSGIGVNLKTFMPDYEITKPDVVRLLIGLHKKAKRTLLATDLDREGEGIAWHLSEVLGLSDPQRVTFDAITESSIKKALAAQRPLDMNLVSAQEARRVLDRMIGYQVSPALGGKRSAGRVQSPALKIIVDRERVIRNFKPEHHYSVTAELAKGKGQAKWNFFSLLPANAEQKIWQDKAIAEQAASNTLLTVSQVNKTEKSKPAPPPFTTSSLQQLASSKLKLSLSDTMAAAQKLFVEGLITYHRTDSPVLSSEAETMVRSYLDGKGLPAPARPNKWKAGKGAQEAHEGIRVTDIGREAGGHSADEQALYALIRNRTLACQMTAMTYIESVTLLLGNVDLNGSPSQFVSRSLKTINTGWTVIESSPSDQSGSDIVFTEGETLSCECELANKDTSPPARYSEGTLVKTMESKQVGRPSTYASILAVLKRRQYVVFTKGKMSPTDEGEAVYNALIKGDFRFMDLNYTKELEGGLDLIAHGKLNYIDLVKEVQSGLEEDIKKIPDDMKARTRNIDPIKGHGEPCDQCGKPMVTRSTKTGKVFLSCSAYPDCKNAKWPDDDIKPVKGHGEPCPKCEKPLATRVIRSGKNKGNKFLSCTGWQKDNKGCDYVDWMN